MFDGKCQTVASLTMRYISESEATVLRTLLAGLPNSEWERVRSTGLSTRTFERIRRRAYTSGWVFDRLVPNPFCSGFATVVFLVAQPFTEDFPRVQVSWETHPANVLLWRGSETVFGVFFFRGSRERFLSTLDLPTGRSDPFLVTSASTAYGVPVYFDFEAAWARFTEQRGTLAYPHGLTAPAYRNPGTVVLSASELALVGRMVTRPLRSGAENRAFRVNRIFMPHSERRMFDLRVIEKRTFLSPQRLPAYQGRSIERLAFVMGELNSPGAELHLFRTLVSAGVYPFLFVSEESRALLGTLSSAPTGTFGGSSTRPAILQILQRHLSRIQIVREPSDSLSVVVNHRYDRLFPGTL